MRHTCGATADQVESLSTRVSSTHRMQAELPGTTSGPTRALASPKTIAQWLMSRPSHGWMSIGDTTKWLTMMTKSTSAPDKSTLDSAVTIDWVAPAQVRAMMSFPGAIPTTARRGRLARGGRWKTSPHESMSVRAASSLPTMDASRARLVPRISSAIPRASMPLSGPSVE